jgi:uncharacterized protein YndB with AHSA1/START domain
MYTAKAQEMVNASPTKVWDSLTNPKLVKQWLFGTDMTADWEVGGKISYKGVWEGKTYEDKGEVVEIVPHKLLVTTYWSNFSGLPDTPENHQKVTYRLIPKDSQTKIEITQEGNPTEESAKHSENNWNQVLAKLKEIVEK